MTNFWHCGCPLPPTSLLQAYANSPSPETRGFTDCYSITLDGHISFADFVATFYATPLFKAERLILKWLVGKPSSDSQAHRLSVGEIDQFAAWTVERRTDDQLLMCDMKARTRSWFMTQVEQTQGGTQTRLYFGSAIVPIKNRSTGQFELGLAFNLLLGLHKFYSKCLLYSAKSRLIKKRTRM